MVMTGVMFLWTLLLTSLTVLLLDVAGAGSYYSDMQTKDGKDPSWTHGESGWYARPPPLPPCPPVCQPSDGLNLSRVLLYLLRRLSLVVVLAG